MTDPIRPTDILVVKSRHIGDVLLTTPLISALAARHPGARIHALVKPGTEAMLTGHPELAGVLIFPARGPGESLAAFARRWAGWVVAGRRLNLSWSINTTEGDRGIIAGVLLGARRRSGIQRKGREKAWRRALLTDPLPNPAFRRHTVLRNLDLIGAGDPGGAARAVRMTFGPEEEQAVTALLHEAGWSGAPLVQVHPTSRWAFKCWNDRHMARVLDHLAGLGVEAVLTSGPDHREIARIRAILAACASRPLDLAGRLSLRQLAALSARCRLFFGVDTAPMHMAAAMDTPVVALFGPSAACNWGPWPNGWAGEATPYPDRGGVQGADRHLVIQKDWPCVPCCRDGCEGSKRSDCLEQTLPEEVIPHLDGILRGH